MQDQTTTSIIRYRTGISATTYRWLQLMAAFMLGALIIYGAGFLGMPAAHNAAHDMRHSQGFPCH